VSGQPTWDSLVFALLYPVLFDPDPNVRIDAVIRDVVGGQRLGATPAQYLKAIEDARASGEDLSVKFEGLLALPHSDGTIWRYLSEIERRLRDDAPAAETQS
jgi:hypothetical protein